MAITNKASEWEALFVLTQCNSLKLGTLILCKHYAFFESAVSLVSLMRFVDTIICFFYQIFKQL